MEETAKARRREEDAKEDEMDVFEFRERQSSGLDDHTEELIQLVIGAAIEVHRHLKPGRPESAYKLALCHELTLRGIAFECEKAIPILYKGVKVGESFLDILVDNRLILELKAVDQLSEVHKAQLIGYLQGTNMKVGLLINFHVVQLKNGIKRVINTYIT
jgi:GxxExxY protein